MGLDVVEFLMSVEEAFQVTIPDQDAQALVTPRRLIDYLTDRLPAGQAPQCLSQRTFYTLRYLICRRLHLPQSALHPNHDLREFFPEPTTRRAMASRWGRTGGK